MCASGALSFIVDTHHKRMPVLDFLNQNSLYIVLIVALVVWLGIYGYLFRIDKKLRQLERKSEQ